MNPDKTNERALISGLNLEAEIDTAIMQLTLTYEYFSRKKMNAKPPAKGPKPIKAFHLIQSFAPGECSAREAHAIGIEWVRQAFGEDFQAIVCTHTDHEHIHNHVLLCPYSLSGKRFNSNLNTLKRIRDVSDSICREQGIGIMEQLRAKPDHEPSSMSYGEWKHRKMGTSWKEKIRVRIDLLAESVRSLEELLSQLESVGYTIKRGKYISVKAPNPKRAVRLKTLGVRYEESHLTRRIEKSAANCPKPKSLDEIIDGVMRKYSYQTRKYAFAQSVQSDIYEINHQLSIINSEHISSIGELEGKLAQVINRISEIESKLSEGELLPWQIDKYSDTLAELRTKEKEYQSIKNTYDEDMKGDYISRMVKAARERMTEQEKAKLEHLKSLKYDIYLPNDDNYASLSDLKCTPNIGNYSKVYTGNWYDAEGIYLKDQLEDICRNMNNIRVGAVIFVDGKAFYVNDKGFVFIKDFDKPISEQNEIVSSEKKNSTHKHKR